MRLLIKTGQNRHKYLDKNNGQVVVNKEAKYLVGRTFCFEVHGRKNFYQLYDTAKWKLNDSPLTPRNTWISFFTARWNVISENNLMEVSMRETPLSEFLKVFMRNLHG